MQFQPSAQQSHPLADAQQPIMPPSRERGQIEVGGYFGLGLAFLFYNFPRACFLLGAANPYASHAFMDMLADRAGYPEVILRIFGTLPVFLLAEGLAIVAGLLGGLGWRNRVRTVAYGAWLI